jgi:adenylate kinase family enzyme
MPSPHFVTRLPAELRAELDQRLRSCGYRDSTEIAAWLTESGYAIGNSAVSAYGKRLKKADLVLPRFLIDGTPETQAAFAALAESLFQVWLALERTQAAMSLPNDPGPAST